MDRTLFYSNMTMPLCIRQGSKINDDSVSVEELDWSAESQVLIPAEHFWCDFKCRHWAKYHPLYIHYMYKSTWTPTSLEEKGYFQTVATKMETKFMYLKFVFPPLLQQCWSVWNDYILYVQAIGFLVIHFWLKVRIWSHTRGLDLGLGLGFLQTSQVLPHWLNHKLSLILALYTEALSC